MKWLVLFHVLGATVWAGGHLILSIGFLPAALRTKNLSIIQHFEKHYERVGIPALLVQVVTGFWMALIYVPFSYWFSLATHHHVLLWIKIGLLLGTIGLAVHARLFIIPKLTTEKLSLLALHIILATVLAVSFVVTGLSFRFVYP
ncbi:MAG: CopD family protein [Cyclobacteriaceae bacterium]|nr:CopD family protein [Cyclobacteriaceae bacterium]